MASSVWTGVPDAEAPAYTRTITVLESAAPVRAVPEKEGWPFRTHEPPDGAEMASVPAGTVTGGVGLITGGRLTTGGTTGARAP